MVAATSIDGSELGALLHWPDEMVRRLPSALWLPADVDDELPLVTLLGTSWESYQWCGLGTWFAPGTAPEPPAGFAGRYSDLQHELIAEGSLTTARGLKVRSEWSTLNPRSGSLHAFLSAIRQARGSGSCLALMAQDASPRAWYAASTAMMQRGLLALGGIGDVDREEADRSASLTYLAAGPASGYASVIPLDRHPWGGYAVVGDQTLLSALAEALPDPLAGLAEASWEDVAGRAGSLAL
ncbi:hypothetical protein [Promicromonospora panici]|uniref:hypothetical protein n=1 Tax=Promicromonospora panici TaxID=2219658 RepID=UPI00101BFF50|nr:hypothetical protein [Promicromonospora panici]